MYLSLHTVLIVVSIMRKVDLDLGLDLLLSASIPVRSLPSPHPRASA